MFRSVKGLRSTGLEADVYDVVITAGGFAKAGTGGHLLSILFRSRRFIYGGMVRNLCGFSSQA